MVKNLPANGEDAGLIPGSGRSPGEGNGNPLQYPCLGTLLFSKILSDCPQNFPSRDAAKSLQSCPTLCDPIDSSPPGSPVPGILQARTLVWVAISFSKVEMNCIQIEPVGNT